MNKATIINSALDLRDYVCNASPGNCVEMATADQIDAIVDALLEASGIDPAFGDDWAPWLDENAARIAFGVLA